MLRLTLRSALAHRTRLALTALAVVLGVAFVTGTLVLTDTMRATVDTITEDAFAAVDVAVLGLEDPAASGPLQADRTPVPADLLDDVLAVDGVAAAVGQVQGPITMLDEAGDPLGGPMTMAVGSGAPSDERLSTVGVREGRYPATDGEIAVDVATAADHDLSVGDTLAVVAGGPVTEQTITGVVAVGGDDEGLGFMLAMFDPATADRLFAVDGDYASIHVLAEDRADPADVRADVAAVVGDAVEVVTGDELRDAETAAAVEGLAFLDQALLGFAGVALLVGSFIIFNTFSIIVAQRTRELAMLRALGASRRQVVATVLGEAVVTGLAGSAIGLGLGLGVATALRSVLADVGVSLPDSPLVVAASTVVVGLVVGVGVTVAAALVPALRSLRVPPMAAMDAVALPSESVPGRGRTIVGAVVTLAGVAGMAVGLFADGGLGPVAAGAVLTIIGFTILAPLVTGPVLRGLARPVRRTRGLHGELAAENALRNPRRTASTAAALMIGLGLVSFAAIFGASITASTAASIGESFRAEYNVRPASMTEAALPDGLLAAVGAADGVDVAMPMRYANLTHDDVPLLAVGVDPAVVDQVLDLAVVEGDVAGLAEGGLVVKESIAVREGWTIGDTVELATPTGTITPHLAATVDTGIDVSWFLANATVEEAVAGAPVAQVFVDVEDGLTLADARPALEEALAPFPTAQLLDSGELQESIEAQVDQVLGLLSALLLLSIVIAVVGLVNTLSLSVFERTRELGLLRAVGASQGQVRAMVRWEAVLVSGLGAVLGLAIGVLFGWLLVEALAEQGITTFALPGAQLAAGFVGAGLAGVLAAVAPARRASRVDVLRALQAT